MKTWVIAVFAILFFATCSQCVWFVIQQATKATSLSTPEALNAMPDPHEQTMTLLAIIGAFLTFMLGVLLTLLFVWRLAFS